MNFMKSNIGILLLSVFFFVNGYQSTDLKQNGVLENTNKVEQIDNSNEQYQHDLLQLQRPELKHLLSAILANLAEQKEEEDEQNELFETESQENEQLNDSEDSFGLSKRSTRSKKEFEEKRNKNLRRQQAAKWDIGFGKRGGPSISYHMKPKSFLDALYGKRSAKNPKVTFGRKQQWDIRYGK